MSWLRPTRLELGAINQVRAKLGMVPLSAAELIALRSARGATETLSKTKMVHSKPPVGDGFEILPASNLIKA